MDLKVIGDRLTPDDKERIKANLEKSMKKIQALSKQFEDPLLLKESRFKGDDLDFSPYPCSQKVEQNKESISGYIFKNYVNVILTGVIGGVIAGVIVGYVLNEILPK
ncbi:hypothetical protein TW85_00225 [Marinomonas sp. S3726]|uniref:hypothetical protein n=1 Tax=Marinomonas sp. S3726 TaxID=579484 RepID=UPI0005F9C0AB|nr:hypothetical protein [Marinomonas sp. S3726]KJZ16446.1 hypothetical protein TW85_00225 [Marinomonas sp. S3726]